MQKTVLQQLLTKVPQTARQSGAAVSTPRGELIAQLEAHIHASPGMAAQRMLNNTITSSPHQVAQRQLSEGINNRPRQAAQLEQRPTPKPNRTGLPDNLKSGIEHLSGMAMDHVKVHYNSSRPAQLNALAYAQGSDIHVAPGQEKHLPHEAWHVVQQAQGRVRPTMQMKAGAPVNDDKGLEHEADVMGKMVKAGVLQAVVQMGRMPREKKKSYWQKKKEKEREYALSPWKRYDDKLDEIKKKIRHAQAKFNIIKDQLDDDDDIKWIEKREQKLKEIGKDARTVRREIRENPPSGRLRSQTSQHDKLVEQLDGFPLSIYLIVETVNLNFPLHAGGFGAKGRAHNMDSEIDPGMQPHGKALDNTFVSHIKIDGNALGHHVYKTTPNVPSEKSGPLTIMGKDKTQYPDKKKTLTAVESKLSAINTPQDVTFTNTPVGKDREGGQYKNMNNTNAAGYAWLSGINSVMSQRWEWLHVRGAGLGGATNSTNLVTGVRDANTHMIPFESNIRQLGTAVKNNPTKYSGLDVRWSVASPIAKHAYQQISIEWCLKNKDSSRKTSGEAHFQPLQTGSNISKNEVDALENALSAARSGV